MESDHLQRTKLSPPAVIAIQDLEEWLTNNTKFVHKEGGFYEYGDEEEKNQKLKPLLEALGVSSTRQRLFRASGPKYPTLFASGGCLFLYPLRLHGIKVPDIGEKGQNIKKVPLEVGYSITITELSYISPGLDFLTLSGGDLATVKLRGNDSLGITSLSPTTKATP
ncbi:MAG: hypothetical protein M1834_003851 [Cirrosporium novae-zelandiae]|nr:MAG: hypothetical protein M1834_003851 [Cirrosporium novae-zelandiae]